VSVINLPVLVLNQNYEPLNICHMPRAIMHVYRGKAEMLENGAGYIHTATSIFELPSVIRMSYLIKRPRPKPKLSRLEIFHRDGYACQYCGRKGIPLTIDHVLPRHRHGGHTWENLVSACIPCNRRKAGRTPEEAGMKLLHKPARPKGNSAVYIPHHFCGVRQEWEKYLPPEN
jgi:5-methylcytosine-specific restriction endonuclease McrA